MNGASFETNGRVVIDMSLDCDGWGLTYFPSVVRKLEGRVNLADNDIKNIDYLEEADNLYLRRNQHLTSMKSLRAVGLLDAGNTRLTNLGS